MSSRERLRIYLRHRQLVGVLNPDDSLDDQVTGNVVVQCNADNSAQYVPGTIDQTWVEFTEFTRGQEKLTVAWDAVNSDDTADAETNPQGSNYEKGVTADLTFNDAAYQFIYDWLLADPCGILNAVEVMITDALCQKTYRLFELKADNLTYAPFDEPCEFQVKLREADAVWHCVHKTFIWDNWQHWFEDGSTKQHPCFLTAVEPRPRLIASARMGISLFGQTIPVVSGLFSENDNTFRRILNVDNFVDAPLVRDIITNACGKCGLAVDTFFHDPANPYYNLCLFYPSSGQWHTNDNGFVTSPALWFHFANRWDITLAEFLDKLKKIFKAEWYVTPNSTLVFKKKGDFLNATPIYDFTTGGAPIWNLRYTFDGTKKPAYGRYQYTPDASDLATQEVAGLYNDIADYDGPANNAMLEGSVSEINEFSPTGFVRDARAEGDYMRDLINDGETIAYILVALLAVVIASLVAGALSAIAGAALAAFLADWVLNIANKASDLRTLFGSDTYTGAVRITWDQVGNARLLLWDGDSLNRAKVVQVAPADIVPVPFYNPDLKAYDVENTFQYAPVGGLFIMNYPMYFDSFFQDNLFDRFHEALDNPLKSLDTHQSFEFYTDLCCSMQDTLGVWAEMFAQIGSVIKIEEREGYDVLGRLEHFEVSYDEERIRLRGKVLKIKTS